MYVWPRIYDYDGFVAMDAYAVLSTSRGGLNINIYRSKHEHHIGYILIWGKEVPHIVNKTEKRRLHSPFVHNAATEFKHLNNQNILIEIAETDEVTELFFIWKV